MPLRGLSRLTRFNSESYLTKGLTMKKRLAFAASLIAFAAASVHAEDALKIGDLSATVYTGEASESASGYISGTATNTTNDTIRSATIAINLLDANGTIVGTTSATANGIGPMQQWKFRAVTSRPYQRAVVASVSTS